MPSRNAFTALARIAVICCICTGLVGCIDIIKTILGSSADTPSVAVDVPARPAPIPEPRISWADARAMGVLNLDIKESKGPVWTIAFYALSSKSKAIKEAKKLRAKGLQSHIAWLGEYGSANNQDLWLVYVGPYARHEEALVRKELATIQKTVRKKAYAVTIGRHDTRRQINKP